MKLEIIYEDKEIIVCYKPSGIASQTASLASQDMVSMVKNYLAKQQKEKSPYLGVIHRLDQPVSGIMVFAKTKKAAADLSRQIQDGNANKDYLAFCCYIPEEKKGTLQHYIMKDPVSRLAKVSQKEENASYKKASLSYEVERVEKDCAVLKIHLHTGRFHQIRAQFSQAGNPLLGDGKYGTEESSAIAREKGIHEIALCAYQLTFKHPRTGEKMEFALKEEFLPDWYKGQENKK